MELIYKIGVLAALFIFIILLAGLLVLITMWLSGAISIRETLFRTKMKKIGFEEVLDYSKFPMIENNLREDNRILIRRIVFKDPEKKVFKVFELRTFGKYYWCVKYDID